MVCLILFKYQEKITITYPPCIIDHYIIDPHTQNYTTTPPYILSTYLEVIDISTQMRRLSHTKKPNDFLSNQSKIVNVFKKGVVSSKKE